MKNTMIDKDRFLALYPELKDTLARFEEDIANHELNILTDDGTTRLLCFANPESSYYKVYITTWPNHLAFSGDVGTFVFSNHDKDMLFWFPDNYDLDYISEKLRAGHAEVFDYTDTGELINREYIFQFVWAVLAITLIAEEYRKIKENLGNQLCFLSSSGFTFTNNEVYDWLKKIVKKIKAEIGEKNLKAYSRGYRVGSASQEFLTFDIVNEKDEIYPLAFCPVARKYGYQLDDVIDVPDLIEAWHMIGMLTQALNIEVKVGVTANEINQYCTDQWTKENQTNAPMNFDF